jgi:hypothetical protein
MLWPIESIRGFIYIYFPIILLLSLAMGPIEYLYVKRFKKVQLLSES